MKQVLSILIVVSFLFSCEKKEESFNPRSFSSVEIETLMKDSLLNVRALENQFSHDSFHLLKMKQKCERKRRLQF